MDGWVFMFLVQSIDGRWGCVEWVLEKLSFFSPPIIFFCFNGGVALCNFRFYGIYFLPFPSLIACFACWWGNRFVQTGLVGCIQ